MRRAFLLLSCFLIATGGFSQTALCDLRLDGIVQSFDGEMLIGANIRIEKSQAATSTDVNGTFRLTDLCEGTIIVVVSFVGFESERVTVRIPAREKFVVKLTPSVKVLHDFVFEGAHAGHHDNAQTVDILSSEDLSLQKGKSLGEMVQQLSGVTALSSGPGIFKPVIQGLHSQRILVLNNGVKQEGQQWGVEHAPEIDSYIASDIEVVKGAETVRYGSDAIGGVIIVSAPALRYSSGIGGEINAQLNSNSRMGATSAMLEGGTNGKRSIAWRVQGSLKRGGDFHTPDYTMSNTGLREMNASAAFGLKGEHHIFELYLSSFNTEIGILRSSHTGNLSDLENSIRDERPWYIRDFTYDITNPRQKINHHLAKAYFKKTLSRNVRLSIQYAAQFNRRREFDIRRSSRNDHPSLSLELFSNTLDVNLEKRFSEWKLNAGMHGAFKNNDNVLSTGILPDYRQATGALYLIGKRAWQKWNFEWGARSEYQYLTVLTFNFDDELVKPDYLFSLISVSAGTTVQTGIRSRISSHASFSSRPPHTSELFSIGLHHSAGAIEEGLLIEDGKLRPSLGSVKQEKSAKWINTWHYTSSRFSLELSGHINLLTNYIFLSPKETRLTIRGFFPVFRYEQSDALFTGGEATGFLTLSKQLKYKGSASFIYAKNISDNDRLPMIPPAQFEQSLTWSIPDRTHFKNTFMKISVPTVLRQGHAPRTVYPSQVDGSETKTFDFMDAPSSYTLVDFYVGTEIPWHEKRLSVAFGCNNVLAERYRSYMNRLRYFTDEPGRNFSARLSWTF
jgi:iron complex outermembrane recepter protein